MSDGMIWLKLQLKEGCTEGRHWGLGMSLQKKVVMQGDGVRWGGVMGMRVPCRWDVIEICFQVLKYPVCFNISGADGAECQRKVASERKVTGAIR